MALKQLTDAQKAIHKAYGAQSGGRGFKFPNFPRLPTGILPLDISLAGGIPMGAVSLFYGNESCGKTSLALRAAAEYQRRFPDRAVCWIDVENAWDEDWVRLHGLDPDLVHLYKPTTAEEAADVAKELGMSEDAGLVVVDSIAALASIQQLEKSAEQTVVSGAAKPSTQLLRNLGAAITEHTKAGQGLTVIYINQPRMKIGFVMGNPEFLPGPVFQNFQAFLKLRLTAKPHLDEKIAPIPIYNDHGSRIVKKKFPCIRQSAEWQMAIYPYEHKGVKVSPLEVNNARKLQLLSDQHGWIHQPAKKGEWVSEITGEVFKTKTAALEAAIADYDGTLSFIVKRLLKLYGDPIQKALEDGTSLDDQPVYDH